MAPASAPVPRGGFLVGFDRLIILSRFRPTVKAEGVRLTAGARGDRSPPYPLPMYRPRSSLGNLSIAYRNIVRGMRRACVWRKRSSTA